MPLTTCIQILIIIWDEDSLNIPPAPPPPFTVWTQSYCSHSWPLILICIMSFTMQTIHTVFKGTHIQLGEQDQRGLCAKAICFSFFLFWNLQSKKCSQANYTLDGWNDGHTTGAASEKKWWTKSLQYTAIRFMRYSQTPWSHFAIPE